MAKNEDVEAGEGPSRIVIALLAIFLGWTGIYKFMLGNTLGGVIMLLTCGGCGWVSLIEGILYLMKTDEEFHQTYVVEKKAWF